MPFQDASQLLTAFDNPEDPGHAAAVTQMRSLFQERPPGGTEEPTGEPAPDDAVPESQSPRQEPGMTEEEYVSALEQRGVERPLAQFWVEQANWHARQPLPSPAQLAKGKQAGEAALRAMWREEYPRNLREVKAYLRSLDDQPLVQALLTKTALGNQAPLAIAILDFLRTRRW